MNTATATQYGDGATVLGADRLNYSLIEYEVWEAAQ